LPEFLSEAGSRACLGLNTAHSMNEPKMKRCRVAFFALGYGLVAPLPAVASDQPKEKVLYPFCSQENCTDGAGPDGMIDVKGTLYGTTFSGGAYTFGIAFSLDRKTGAETVLHSFGNGLDGADPEAGLIDVKGALYGTTEIGGTYGYGTVFALDPDTGVETTLYSFCRQDNCADGVIPVGGLITVKDSLYGTTNSGGGNGQGAVFALDRHTGAETVVYSFCSQEGCTDGAQPAAGLIDVNGILYGTTAGGGNEEMGTIFSLDPDTGAETVLYSFCSRGSCGDGAGPQAGLIYANSMLYGTTASGGNFSAKCSSSDGCGTVFVFDLNTGQETVLHSFCGQQNCADGALPTAGLIDVNGTLYGTTSEGGAYGSANCSSYGCGTAFSLDQGTGDETVLHAFCSDQNCVDGAFPSTSMVHRNGRLYSTTGAGGSAAGCPYKSGCGTVFELKKFSRHFSATY
jgi:uncharacterized repeat protein (TIGR03803 family)